MDRHYLFTTQKKPFPEFLNGLSLYPPLGSIRTFQMPLLMEFLGMIEKLRKEGKI